MIPLSNLRGSMMARAYTTRSRLPIMPCIRLLVFAGRGCGKLSVMRGFFPTLKSIWDWFYCPLYGVAGCPFWRGYERTELHDKTIGTCEFVRYNVLSVVEGCPLSGVPLYALSFLVF